MPAVSEAVVTVAPADGATLLTRAPDRSDRIGVLDVLRGVALLGMCVVHVADVAQAPSVSSIGEALVSRTVELFFSERFWALFAILFGAGFAVQLSRAEARGDRFIPRYLRRIAALLCIGLVVEVAFGYHVLVEYALWGLPLLLVRTWPVRRLVVLLVVCAVAMPAFIVGRAAYMQWQLGVDGARETFARQRAEINARYEVINKMKASTHYPTVMEGRIRQMPVFYTRPFMVLPSLDFTLFLIGVIAFRLGVFRDPADHRVLIGALALFGIAAWGASEFWLSRLAPAASAGGPASPLQAALTGQLGWGFGLVRTMWLTFTYAGVVLLIVAHNSAWLQRLSVFGIVGRMALTNYIVQTMVLDVAFSNHALGLNISHVVGVFGALFLFGAQVLLSWWWLTRYRFGPLEWLWRSVTYWKWQPMTVSRVP